MAVVPPVVAIFSSTTMFSTPASAALMAAARPEIPEPTMTMPAVRSFLLEMQRRAAAEHDVIMDGRDIGTVVLPGADLKIYLTAAAEARAERRCRELRERGQAAEFDQVLAEVVERDRRDSQREAAPLRQAEDAVVADTTSLDLEGSFQLLLGLARKHLGLTEGEGHE